MRVLYLIDPLLERHDHIRVLLAIVALAALLMLAHRLTLSVGLESSRTHLHRTRVLGVGQTDEAPGLAQTLVHLPVLFVSHGIPDGEGRTRQTGGGFFW